jgi:hypothetical protein
MAVAVTGLLTSLSTSMRNASRLLDADRAAMLARQKMDELLLDTRLPLGAAVDGNWDPAFTGGQPAGWRALVEPFEAPPNAPPGSDSLERVQLQIWWGPAERRRTFTLEAYRAGHVPLQQGGPR